eukprot:9052974-Pyramimonas_sp.AAC.1
MTSGEYDALINSRAAELTCLRLYSIFKAYRDVEVESDWKRPKNTNGGKWNIKVNWSYGEEFLKMQDGSRPSAEAVDDEVAERLRKRAAITKHLAVVGDRAHADE